MYIQLTNSHPDYLNEPIIINTHNIVTVYTQEVAANLRVTCIHCPPYGTWNVQESISEVRARLDRVTLSERQKAVPEVKSA